MDPDKFFQPSTNVGQPPQPTQPGQVPGTQYGGLGQQPPVPQQNPPQPVQQPPKKSQKPLIIVSIIVGGAVGLVVIALVVSSGGKTANQNQEQTQAQDSTTQAEILDPAQSVEVEQTSNSLSQDLSSLDDEKDLPADSLDDKTLGL